MDLFGENVKDIIVFMLTFCKEENQISLSLYKVGIVFLLKK